MKAISSFQSDILRKVTSKCWEPILDRTLNLEPAEEALIVIPEVTRRKLVYVLSALELVDVETTEAELLIGASASHTLKLTPGEAQVVPVAAGVNRFSVTSNSASAGTVRIVVL